jgi:hypothetical protein
MTLLLTACAGERKSPKPSEDWSRGLLLTDDSVGSAGLAVDESLRQVYVVWPVALDKDMAIRFTRLDDLSEPVISKDLQFPGQLIYPSLVSGSSGELHLFWASRPSGSPGWSLWHAKLDQEGNLLEQARQVSSDEDNVGNYTATPDAAGGALVAWSQWSTEGIYLLHIGEDGKALSQQMEVSSSGESPAARVGPDGDVHVAWMGEGGVHYAILSLEDLSAPVEGQLVAEIKMGTGASLIGPELGLSEDWVYVFWSLLNQSGLEAGTSKTQYVAFPLGAPEKTPVDSIWILPEEEQIYEPYQGELALSQLIKPPQEAWATTDYIMRPAVMQDFSVSSGANPDLAVAVAANQLYRLNPYLQIAVAVFADGEFKGYSYVSKTEQISDYPVIFFGPSGNLYTLWREKMLGSDVYYAATEANARENLDDLTAADFTDAALQGTIEMLVSIAFMPFVGLGWMLGGFIVLGIWKIIRDQDDMSMWINWPALAIGFLVYFAIKLATLPTFLTYVPFSAWIFIPEGLQDLLRYGVPLAILAIALAVGHWVRVKYSDSVLIFYTVASLTDAMLTLAIYGVNFLGVF